MDDPAFVSFAAFGSMGVLALRDPTEMGAARSAVQRVVDDFDLACSRFRDDSELERVNRAGGSPTRVSELLLDAVDAALRAAELTDGDVDPTVGEALIALGYDRDIVAVSARGGGPAPVRLATVPGWRSVHVDRAAGTVRIARGVKLDLGATAKALAADRAAVVASEAAGCGALVSLGGDISIQGPAPDAGWRVRVTDDHRAGTSAPGQWIVLHGGGLATSSTAVRRWQTQAGTAHHVIDPATARSVDSFWRTVSVNAASCLDANIASTAALVRGVAALEWLESLRLPSRLVGVDGRVRHVAGWPGERDDLPEASP